MDQLKVQAQSLPIYLPPDEFNYWMLATIGVGCAFVVFVIASVYLMCNATAGNQPQPLMRRPSQPNKIVRNALNTAERDHL